VKKAFRARGNDWRSPRTPGIPRFPLNGRPRPTDVDPGTYGAGAGAGRMAKNKGKDTAGSHSIGCARNFQADDCAMGADVEARGHDARGWGGRASVRASWAHLSDAGLDAHSVPNLPCVAAAWSASAPTIGRASPLAALGCSDWSFGKQARERIGAVEAVESAKGRKELAGLGLGLGRERGRGLG
jgi:hypothetical protein